MSSVSEHKVLKICTWCVHSLHAQSGRATKNRLKAVGKVDMADYLGWVAITALVSAVAALGVGLAEMRRRRRRDATIQEAYAAWQGLHVMPASTELADYNQKWERAIRESETDQKVSISEWSAALNEAVYQPVAGSGLAHRYRRP